MSKLLVEIQRTDTTTNVYKVNYTSDMTVLTILEEIYRHHDPSIAYRFSCRTGLCATCMMMINGKPGLSCMKLAKPGDDGYLSLAPLPKGKTLRDLVKEV
ncbi:2Fe-2S iron-sulfur cluster-binding protein [Halalkalibacter alkaliphilus]|uniref:2Fe-2S iron-sulfur cluster-binding protein n=1 Tax=Halalkalibacter alkaliphilus TaxID=2917993 RepID=A0A9X2CWS9_9BACI|nr:2Fe-2S iron-sulfur cluster-binding protein [Halalkalibacter alkaliphilus]MCL7749686.1 2Fe-2S iron-sulfur cluster-binding protein [Halalkalibacter alkaliphilus]